MPLPEGYLPREGDVLILHGVVRWNVDAGENDVHLFIDRRYKHSGGVCVPLDQIIDIHCRAWEVGSKVIRKGGNQNVGTVLATYEDQVWVAFSGGSPVSIHANALEPAPEPAADQEPAPQTAAGG